MPAIHSAALLDWLKELGVPIDDTHHVTIDIPAREPVTITIKVFADRKITTLPIPDEIRTAERKVIETRA